MVQALENAREALSLVKAQPLRFAAENMDDNEDENDRPNDDDGRLVVQIGDITKIKVDAIVNAANVRMLGGGGVDGAIHRAAGPELKAACKKVKEVSPGVRCTVGAARATKAFGKLKARLVIATVGPDCRPVSADTPTDEEDRQLRACYRSCLELAEQKGVLSLSFPAISAGVFGFPVAAAAEVAASVCREWLDAHALPEKVLFIAMAPSRASLSGAPDPRYPSTVDALTAAVAAHGAGSSLDRLSSTVSSRSSRERFVTCDDVPEQSWEELLEQGYGEEDGSQFLQAAASYAAAECHKCRSDCLLSLGDYEAALQAANASIACDVRGWGGWSNRGVSQYNLGRPVEAAASYEKALQLAPPDEVLPTLQAALGSAREAALLVGESAPRLTDGRQLLPPAVYNSLAQEHDDEELEHVVQVHVSADELLGGMATLLAPKPQAPITTVDAPPSILEQIQAAKHLQHVAQNEAYVRPVAEMNSHDQFVHSIRHSSCKSLKHVDWPPVRHKLVKSESEGLVSVIVLALSTKHLLAAIDDDEEGVSDSEWGDE